MQVMSVTNFSWSAVALNFELEAVRRHDLGGVCDCFRFFLIADLKARFFMNRHAFLWLIFYSISYKNSRHARISEVCVFEKDSHHMLINFIIMIISNSTVGCAAPISLPLVVQLFHSYPINTELKLYEIWIMIFLVIDLCLQIIPSFLYGVKIVLGRPFEKIRYVFCT